MVFQSAVAARAVNTLTQLMQHCRHTMFPHFSSIGLSSIPSQTLHGCVYVDGVGRGVVEKKDSGAMVAGVIFGLPTRNEQDLLPD